MSTKLRDVLKTHRETTYFFNGLIKITGTYFLSDCVHEVYGYLNEKTVKDLEKQRDELKRMCELYGLDIHAISQKVAEVHPDINLEK